MMKLEIDKHAQITLTSNNAAEREYLIKMYQKHEQGSKGTAPITHRVFKKGKYKRICDITGCGATAKGTKGLSAHKQRAHGISAVTGEVAGTFSFKGKKVPVAHPVTDTGNGEYKLI